MTNEELKKKIADIVEANSMCPDEGECRTCKYHKEICDDSDNPNYSCITLKVVDALIAAGLRFGENLTATFDHMVLKREHELEHRFAEASMRTTAERALVIIAERVLAYAEKARVTAMTSDGLFSCDKNAQLALLTNDALIEAEARLKELKGGKDD